MTNNNRLFDAYLRQYLFAKRGMIVRQDGRNPMRLVSACAAFAVFRGIFLARFDRDVALQTRLLTALYELHVEVPLVPIAGPVAFRTAAPWLAKHFPMQVSTIAKDPQKDNMLSLQDLCKRLQASFEAEVRRAKLSVAKPHFCLRFARTAKGR